MSKRSSPPIIITIPSSDAAFRQHVERLRLDAGLATAEQLEARLRRVFPRVAVRERALSGEPPSWYVYRDGGWQPSETGPWWQAADLPTLTVSEGGWISDANATALSLLGLEPPDLGARHFTDFVAPGTLDDVVQLFGIVDAGHALTATMLLRPASGDLIAVDVHAARRGSDIVGVLRLAEGVEVDPVIAVVASPELVTVPETDLAFRGYAQLAVERMSDPSPDGLALRLRRLYPHARVVPDGGRWVVSRDGRDLTPAGSGWWLDPALPRVQYDGQALIVEANEAARALLGHSLVGHHWQEFVTPGSTEQVAAMLAILAEVGGAESRFRIPGADGSLVEFDSYTRVDGDWFTTVMRPST